jgi:hypothetical protein
LLLKVLAMKMILTQSLCETFQERAEWTNRIIQRSHSTSLSILEETITNINLVEIADKHRAHVLTKQFTRKEEGADSGADWLWCIGEQGSWLPILIQAKIVNPSTRKCYYLNYRGGKQRQLLLAFSRKNKLLPFYLLYSSIDYEFKLALEKVLNLPGVESEQWACSLLSPIFVRKLVQAKKSHQLDLLKHSIPWAYPFIYSNSKDPEDVNLAGRLAEALFLARKTFLKYEKLQSSLSESRQKSEPTGQRIQWENCDPRMLVQPTIPRILARLLDGKLRPAESPVAGVSLISTKPIEPTDIKELIDETKPRRNTLKKENHKKRSFKAQSSRYFSPSAASEISVNPKRASEKLDLEDY